MKLTCNGVFQFLSSAASSIHKAKENGVQMFLKLQLPSKSKFNNILLHENIAMGLGHKCSPH